MKPNIQRRKTAVSSATNSLWPKSREHSSLAKDIQGSKHMKTKQFTAESPNNPMLTQLSPIPNGVTIIGCSDASTAGEVRNTITQIAVKRADKLGLSMPNVEAVISLHSGNSRKVEQAKLLHGANPQPKSAVPHEFKIIGSRDSFDWCSNEGLSTLLPLIESAENKWLILEQQVVGQVSPILANGLNRISFAAKQFGVWVMVMAVCEHAVQKAPLLHLCEEYIEVTKCEPYPGFYTAFAFDCINIRDLNPFGFGNTMCSVKLTDGVLRREFEPFVSHKLLTRAIWSLRGQQKTVEEIAKLVGLNKSNVSRSLARLPPTRNVNIHPHWLDDYLESIQGNRQS